MILLSLWKIPSMKANYNSQDYFPEGDTLVSNYKIFSQEFATEADHLLIALKNKPDVLDSNFIKKLNQLDKILIQDSSILKITGIHNYKELTKTPFGFYQKTILSPGKYIKANAKKRLLNDPRVNGFLINATADAACLILQTTKKVSNASAKQLIGKIKQQSKELGLGRPIIGGRIYSESTYISQLEKENLKLTPLFIIVVSLVLLVLYRSILASLLPTFGIIVGLILLYGYAAWIGRGINIATLMFPTVMVVVGISDLIHLYTKYQEELKKSLPKLTAISNSVSELRTTLFLTSLTTAIGFICVSFSKIPYVHNFGLDAAVGSGISFLIALLLTPILFHYIPIKHIRFQDSYWDSFLNKVYSTTLEYPKLIVIIAISLGLIGLIGTLQIDTNNKILSTISDKSELKKDFKYFEEEFSGIRTIELIVSMKDGQAISNYEVIQEIDKIESYFNSIPSVGYTLSPTTFYKSINDANKGAPLSNFTIPENEKSFGKLSKTSRLLKNPMLNKDQTKGLISIKMKDVGRNEMNKILRDFEIFKNVALQNESYNIDTTGRHFLIDRTNNLMVKSMFEGLFVALIVISLIIFFLFKNFKIVIISLIPNILPLLLTAGVMGFLNIELNGSSAIIFTIAFVIAVDDTIHFLKKFIHVKKNHIVEHKEEYIRLTMLGAGKGILITSIILISGYSILLFSDFREAYYHGVLISCTMIWAILADLFLLPILLRKFS